MLGPDRGFCSTKLPFWKVKFGLASAFFFRICTWIFMLISCEAIAFGRIVPKLRKHVQRKTCNKGVASICCKEADSPSFKILLYQAPLAIPVTSSIGEVLKSADSWVFFCCKNGHPPKGKNSLEFLKKWMSNICFESHQILNLETATKWFCILCPTSSIITTLVSGRYTLAWSVESVTRKMYPLGN